MKTFVFSIIHFCLIILFTIGIAMQSMRLNAHEQKIGSPFKLLTTLYNEKNPKRCNEFITCLEKNLQHPCIDTIQVLYEDDKHESVILSYLKSKNIKISYISERASFGDFFTVANKEYPGCRIIVSNADIYFNDTLALLKPYDLSGKFLALTRWEVCEDGSLVEILPRGQDTWIFATPLRPFEITSMKLGILGCDPTIAYQAQKSGLVVFNPSLSIQCCHLHLSALRNYPSTDLYKHLGEWTHIPKCTVMEIDAEQKRLLEENVRLSAGCRKPIILTNA